MVCDPSESGKRGYAEMASLDNFKMHVAVHRHSGRVGFVYYRVVFVQVFQDEARQLAIVPY